MGTIRDGLRAVLVLVLALGPTGGAVSARTYHVDSEHGDDAAGGLLPDDAWRTLTRVNEAALEPGDAVLFRRGGLYRGSLHAASGAPGEPVRYGAYGAGPKPILQGSVARDAPADWVEERPGLWATQPLVYTREGLLDDLRANVWSLHAEGGASATLTTTTGNDDRPRVTVACRAAGSRANHLQLWGPEVPGPLADAMLLRLRWRCDQPFRAPLWTIRRPGSPYTAHASSPPDFAGPEADWTTTEVPLHKSSDGDRRRVHLYLGGRLPAGANLELELLGLHAARSNQEVALNVDVGNLIFDHGVVCGWKKWSIEALSEPGDYFYDGASQRVWLRSDGDPAERHQSVELAMKHHVIDQSGAHDVVYEGLHLRNGAAHGIGGGNTARIVVRECDVSYIGGAHQMTPEGGSPVRYGNGIEFWSAASDSVVENCRLWEIYDAALTNQGSGESSVQTNIVYRNNVTWNSEYSFEYWNRPAEAITSDIVFEHNTCVDSGYGWAHAQRPNPNGAHLMCYRNVARTSNFQIRNNVFCNSTEVCWRMDTDWRDALTVEHNLWYQAAQPLVRWLVKDYFGLADFEAFRQATGMGRGGAAAQPIFVDAAARDYRLADGSPGLTLATDGGRVGAR